MENENSNEEPLMNEQPVNETVNKDKRASVLKQLDNKKLYPVQERVGIYIIAVLSIIGLVLIGYTGVMAITSNDATNAETSVVDANEIYELLDEIDLGGSVEDEEPENEDFESNHEYLEPEDEEVEPEPEEEPEDEEDAPVAPTTATINAEFVGLRREPGLPDRIGELHVGYVVDIIDIESNPFWARVSYDGLEGYVDRGFIDFD